MIIMQFLLEILHKISSVYYEKKKKNQKRKALLGQLLLQDGAGRGERGGGGGERELSILNCPPNLLNRSLDRVLHIRLELFGYNAYAC